MNTIVRLVSVTVALVLMLIVGSGIGRQWVRRQDEILRVETLSSRRNQFEQLTQTMRLGAPPWDPVTKKVLADAVGAAAIVDLIPGNLAESSAGPWSFFYKNAAQPGTTPAVRIDITPPPLVRLLSHYQQAAVVLVLLALTLLVLLGAAIIMAARRARENSSPEPPEPGAERAAGLKSLTRLARVSVEQGEALERERNERLRIQEDLNFQQMLLNRSLEEKIRLGHDLHDGIIQALYATGLTLEAAKGSVAKNPEMAGKQLELALQTLNTTIRDVRSYILGLAPEAQKHRTFTESVRSITETLGMGRAVAFDLKIDAQAASQFSEEESADLLQIVRESVSNGIRHGHASEITVRLEEDQKEFCLLIQDNGRGFDLERVRRGNGLSNIEARSERLGANVRCSSTPGSGTRIVVTMTPKVISG